jgi:hypothetical protein
MGVRGSGDGQAVMLHQARGEAEAVSLLGAELERKLESCADLSDGDLRRLTANSVGDLSADNQRGQPC